MARSSKLLLPSHSRQSKSSLYSPHVSPDLRLSISCYTGSFQLRESFYFFFKTHMLHPTDYWPGFHAWQCTPVDGPLSLLGRLYLYPSGLLVQVPTANTLTAASPPKIWPPPTGWDKPSRHSLPKLNVGDSPKELLESCHIA